MLHALRPRTFSSRLPTAALAVVAALSAPVRASDGPPSCTWLEELATTERAGQRDPRVRATILERGGLHALAALREELTGRAELDTFDVENVVRALERERFAVESARAARAPRPRESEPKELAAWLWLRGDVEDARALVVRLAADDASAEAAVLRLLVRAETEEIDGATVAAFAATRTALETPATAPSWPSAQCAFAALALHADVALAGLASRELQSAEMSQMSESPEDYEPPEWANARYPEPELAARLVRRDGAACARALAAAREAPVAAPDRAEQVARSLAEACAADVFAASPWLELARWRVERREPERALEAVDAALRREPASADAWRLRAVVSDVLGDPRAVLVAAERVLELAPSDPVGERLYVAALVRLGQIDEAALAGRELGLADPRAAWPVIAEILAAQHDGAAKRTERWRKQLATFLDDGDEYVRLWSAATLGVLTRGADERARTALTALARSRGSTDAGAAASVLLAGDGELPVWGGFARFVHGDLAAAIVRWNDDAARSGTAAVTARGLLASYRGKPAWPAFPTAPAYAPEPLVELPDPSAVCVRVPSEARDVADALDVLPPHARRIVLARGIHAAPKEWKRAADLVGLGSESTLAGPDGARGGTTIALGAGNVIRLAELRVDAYVRVESGSLAARRVDANETWFLGEYTSRLGRVEGWFDGVAFHESLRLDGAQSSARLADCVFDDALATDVPLKLYLAQAKLVRCTVKQSAFLHAPFSIAGATAHLVVEDGRVAGHLPADGKPRPVVSAAEGATARFLRTRIADLEPVASDSVAAESCHFQRTTTHVNELPGWTPHGRAPVARRDDLAPLRVPEDQPMLASALAAAEPGRTIQLGAGIHYVTDVLSRDVVITGVHGQRTLLQCPGSALPVRGACVVLRELELVGAGLEVTLEPGRVALVPFASAVEKMPALARVEDGTLALDTNVTVRDPRGLVFEVGPGGAVLGRAGVWLVNGDVGATVSGDGLCAVEVDLEFRRWIDAAGAWRGFGKSLPRAAHRPLRLACEADPDAEIERSRSARLADVDAVLARRWPAGGIEFLADVLNRVWALAPANEREEALFARLEPRLAELARRDARAGVEDVLTLVYFGIGGADSADEIQRIVRRIVRVFVAHVPHEHDVYVRARLRGIDAAEADVAARRAACLEALAAGRGQQALALADGLDAIARADVLSLTAPRRLGWSELDQLLEQGGLSAELERRLRILKTSYFAAGPAGPTPLPSAWTLINAYSDAARTGVGNQYFAFRERDYGSAGWGYETVMRPEYTTAPPQRPPEPTPPAVGAKLADWERYYTDLEAWAR